ncbi:hypothetical protein NFI96_002665 [Prochilodus magdalenae]|nr:hypothetical protein NFI96_002665 [Prochilodus magdalenae]
MIPKTYDHRKEVFSEIVAVMSQYRHLEPVLDRFGNMYNIPLCLWLEESYPRTPPICYVKPTKEMMIVSGNHVNSNGQILLPYLDEWRHTKCDLHSLIQVLMAVFGETPPLRMRPVFNDGSSRELMSLTGTVPVSYRGNVYNIPVCLWLLDTYPYNPPICFVKPTSAMMIKTGKHIDANGKIYLPYLHEWKHPQSDLYGLIQVMIVVFGEEPPVFSRPTTQPPYQAFQATGPPNLVTQAILILEGLLILPQGVLHSTLLSLQSLLWVGPSRDGTIGEDTIRASLISAVSDKLRWRMKEEMDRAQAELDALKRTEEDLKKGHQKLEEMVSRLDQEVAEVDRNIDLLKKKDEELTEALEKMENQSENNDIDDVIVPTAPLYKQILNLYAEENAIEDTIFYLGEALRRGVIDLEVFLKHVRLLSRKQFQLRALMQKARKTAGLSDLY